MCVCVYIYIYIYILFQVKCSRSNEEVDLRHLDPTECVYVGIMEGLEVKETTGSIVIPCMTLHPALDLSICSLDSSILLSLFVSGLLSAALV